MSLRDRLVARIRATGPLTIADYMRDCLFDPTEGYYATRAVFGGQGDFITAPEISQMFGELLGLSLAQSWLDQGSVAPFTLAELGPGRGTLMADILRATARVPGFHAGLDLVLAEASRRLRGLQSAALARRVTFVDSADELPQRPLFLVANEFLDALPIRQFVRRGDLWAERQVGLAGDDLCFGLAPPAPLAALNDRLSDTREGDLVELCPEVAHWVVPVARHIAKHGGVAILIDYGSGPSLGDTLQAVSRHGFADPLAAPGHDDLTAHVDFVALVDLLSGENVQVSQVTPQGDLLFRLGIAERSAHLANGLSDAKLSLHLAAYRRLTSPDEMGTLFKAIAIAPKGQSLPPGFGT